MAVDVTELKAYARHLNRAAERIQNLASKVVVKTGTDIEATAKRLSPVDTGNLRNSIGRDYSEDRLSCEVGPTANYGLFVEYGTARMSPQPYMIPAANKHLPVFEKACEQIIEKAL